jgi:hypothetical protein
MAALAQLKKIPKDQAKYYDHVIQEMRRVPENGSLYLLQLLRWGVKQPEVEEEFVNPMMVGDLEQKLSDFTLVDPRIALLKLGLEKNRVTASPEDLDDLQDDLESLRKELGDAESPVDAALVALNDWGNKMAEM